jgi:hypothetical protein
MPYPYSFGRACFYSFTKHLLTKFRALSNYSDSLINKIHDTDLADFYASSTLKDIMLRGMREKPILRG